MSGRDVLDQIDYLMRRMGDSGNDLLHDLFIACRDEIVRLRRRCDFFEMGGRVSFGDCSPAVKAKLARLEELERLTEL